MTRLEFLKVLWGKYVKPALLLVLLFFTSRFLVHAIISKGSERSLLVFLIIVSTIAFLVILLHLWISLVSNWVTSRLPDSVTYALENTRKVLRILTPLIFLWIVYELIAEEQYIELIVAVCFLIPEYWRKQGTNKEDQPL